MNDVESKVDSLVSPLLWVSSRGSSKSLQEHKAWAMRTLLSDTSEFNWRMEYECMWDNYDQPVVTKEVDNTKIMLYKAWGIPKGNIAYKTEFANKTKELYLNVNGQYKDENIGFENDINIHLLIDINVYDRYEVTIQDGMVKIVLHEVLNEEPYIMDITVTRG